MLNWAAFKAGRDAAQGRLDPEDARAQLEQAAIGAGLDEREIDATIQSGLRAGERVA